MNFISAVLNEFFSTSRHKLAYIHVVTFVKSCKKVRKCRVAVFSRDMPYSLKVVGTGNREIPIVSPQLICVQKALSDGLILERAC